MHSITIYSIIAIMACCYITYRLIIQNSRQVLHRTRPQSIRGQQPSSYASVPLENIPQQLGLDQLDTGILILSISDESNIDGTD